MKKIKGFTLIELLIVIAIIAILAAIIFVALNPLKRFRDSRDSVRWDQAAEIANAIKLDQVDNGGGYLTAIDDMVSSTVYMITDGGVGSNCDDNNLYCQTNVDSDNKCVDLSALVIQGYIGDVPISPSDEVDWDEDNTGYTLEKESTGIIIVRACEYEGSEEVVVVR